MATSRLWVTDCIFCKEICDWHFREDFQSFHGDDMGDEGRHQVGSGQHQDDQKMHLTDERTEQVCQLCACVGVKSDERIVQDQYPGQVKQSPCQLELAQFSA